MFLCIMFTYFVDNFVHPSHNKRLKVRLYAAFKTVLSKQAVSDGSI